MANASRRAVLRGLAIDALAISGAGLMSYGAWLIYAPSGFIVGGAILLIVAAAGARA